MIVNIPLVAFGKAAEEPDFYEANRGNQFSLYSKLLMY
jgi:hypothetical protein